MVLSDEKREEMRRATYEAAAALAYDLRYMRGALESTHPSGDDVRLLSGMIRRMLLEAHVVAVAGPRIGRVKFQIPDFGETIETRPGDFVTLGFSPSFGLLDSMCHDIAILKKGRGGKPETIFTLGHPFMVGQTRMVPKEQLMAERLSRYRGEFITRQEFLQFICYHAFGVHFCGKEEPCFEIIRRIMYQVTVGRGRDPQGNATFVLHEDLEPEKPKRLIMNLAHLHTFSTGWYLINSPDVVRLQAAIEAEVASHESAADDGPY